MLATSIKIDYDYLHIIKLIIMFTYNVHAIFVVQRSNSMSCLLRLYPNANLDDLSPNYRLMINDSCHNKLLSLFGAYFVT